MSTTTVILAQLEVERCAAELSLNGIPVVRITPDQIPIANVAADPGYYRLLHSNTGAVVEEPGWGSTASSLPIADGLITI